MTTVQLLYRLLLKSLFFTVFAMANLKFFDILFGLAQGDFLTAAQLYVIVLTLISVTWFIKPTKAKQW